MAEIIIISAASAAIGVLIGLRMFERRRGAFTRMSDAARRCDPALRTCSVVCARVGTRTFDCYETCVQQRIPSFWKRVWNRVSSRVDRIVERTQKRLRGERVLRNTGSVSFFLRDVHEHKRVRRSASQSQR